MNVFYSDPVQKIENFFTSIYPDNYQSFWPNKLVQCRYRQFLIFFSCHSRVQGTLAYVGGLRVGFLTPLQNFS